MVSIQQDYLSYLFADFRDVLAILPIGALNAAGLDWQQRLLAWDGDTSVGSVEATVFEQWCVRALSLCSWRCPLTFGRSAGTRS